jgi:hypothetical protein
MNAPMKLLLLALPPLPPHNHPRPMNRPMPQSPQPRKPQRSRCLGMLHMISDERDSRVTLMFLVILSESASCACERARCGPLLWSEGLEERREETEEGRGGGRHGDGFDCERDELDDGEWRCL